MSGSSESGSRKRQLKEIRDELGPEFHSKISKIINREPLPVREDDFISEDLFEDLFELRDERCGRRAAEARLKPLSETTLRTLWNESLGQYNNVPFRKDGSATSKSYRSRHAAAAVTTRDFSRLGVVVLGPDDFLDVRASLILTFFKSAVVGGGYLSYSTEAQLATLVQNLLLDIFVICGLQNVATVRAEMSLTGNDGSKKRPDIWIVEINGSPRLVIDVKSPTSPRMIEDPKVCGQMFDYLVSLQSCFGSRAIGVITDVKNWRVCWLPSEDALAAVTTREAAADIDITATDLHCEDRTLHVSAPISLHDADLPKLLASALLNSYLASPHRLSLVSESRLLIAYGADQWSWRKLTPTAEAKKVHLCSPPQFICTAFALRLFSTGMKRAFPAIDDTSRAIYVAKVFYPNSDSNAERCRDVESDNWLNVWGIQTPKGMLDGGFAMQLPLAVMCTTFTIDCQPTFIPKVSIFLASNKILNYPCDDKDLAVVHQIDAEYEAALRGWTPLRALTEAVAHMSGLGYLHTDIEWRHVGLLPVFDAAEHIVSLRPILIDLEDVQRVGVDTATASMNARVDDMRQSLQSK